MYNFNCESSLHSFAHTREVTAICTCCACALALYLNMESVLSASSHTENCDVRYLAEMVEHSSEARWVLSFQK